MSIKIRLDELSPGQRGRIAAISSCGALRQRMMEMGLVNGAEVAVIRRAPSGDPVEILLKGYSLALRKAEAVNVFLEVDQI
jgi:ferrous iron transport protein A